MIFFNGHYGISLLDVHTAFPLVPASLGSRPCYEQDVSVLYRNNKYSLVFSHGSIQCLENPFLERNHYMFASFSTRLVIFFSLNCIYVFLFIIMFDTVICLLQTSVGGPVVNNSGEVIGLIVKHIPQAAIASISIVRKCIQMWNQFGYVS